MGCCCSEVEDKDLLFQRFSRRLSRKEPLASALLSHFEYVVNECEFLSEENRTVQYPQNVAVNDSKESANLQKLYYSKVCETVKEFLVVAVVLMDRMNYTGSLKYRFHGAEGTSSCIILSGKICGENDVVFKQPYRVKFTFYCALESGKYKK